MMNERRGFLRISHDILIQARYGCGLTRIVYGANLNFRIVKGYIKKLKNHGLIKIETPDNPNRNKLFTTTKRGIDFIQGMNNVLNIWEKQDLIADG